MAVKKVSTFELQRMKERGEKITALTAYDHPSARILDGAGLDVILVGDSAANVVLGYDSTLPISMEEMLMLTAAVARGTRRAMVIADMPFMSYQVSPEQALANAGRFVKEAGAEGIKLEGGRRSLPAIEAIVAAGIPVMGHLGLTPQSHLQFGGHRIQGRGEEAERALIEDAEVLAAAGVFAFVLEGIPWDLARRITAAVPVPTIGIGAGEYCDGQILVLHDVIGIGAGNYKFVKRYAQVEQTIADAVKRYCKEVRAGEFPNDAHRFESRPTPLAKAKGGEGG